MVNVVIRGEKLRAMSAFVYDVWVNIMNNVRLAETISPAFVSQFEPEIIDLGLYGSAYQSVELSAGVVLTSVADGLRLTITPGEWSGNGRGDEENAKEGRVLVYG